LRFGLPSGVRAGLAAVWAETGKAAKARKAATIVEDRN
jgi:hypothetical protein